MSHISIAGTMHPRYEQILSSDALAFVTELHELFAGTRSDLLAYRMVNRTHFTNGRRPTFLKSTSHIREDASWFVAGPGPGLEDRRVEITGPTDPKMTCNAMNSGAKVWLADLEDSTSPTWENIIGGQISLYDAIRRQLTFDSGEKVYSITSENPPTIVMRPRGWHMVEKHLLFVDQEDRSRPAVAGLVDFGLYFFHNAKELIARGAGPYFYLAKIESHAEAQLWNNIFTYAEERLEIPFGTIRATVLIETIPAAFEMDEILWELRDHCAGLNAGRWDYIFSIIKNFAGSGKMFLTPDRAQITMTVPFMRAYTELLVSTCHKRKAHAIGGMSAFIPNRRDKEVTDRALEAVKKDKAREAADGFDGTWVAHPDLIPIAQAEFDAVLGKKPNQVDRLRDDVHVTPDQLLYIQSIGGDVTEAGLRTNVAVGLRYIEAWLRGTGAVAIDNLMEDVATAEISRSQIWQWVRYEVITREGTHITRTLVEQIIFEILGGIERDKDDRFEDAVTIFRQICLDEDHFPTFLTLSAYSQFLVDPA
jgi:malate synthase